MLLNSLGLNSKMFQDTQPRLSGTPSKMFQDTQPRLSGTPRKQYAIPAGGIDSDIGI